MELIIQFIQSEFFLNTIVVLSLLSMVVIGVWIFLAGLRQLKLYQKIETQSITAISNIAAGFIQVQGMPQRECLIKSPITNKAYLAYRFWIEKYLMHDEYCRDIFFEESTEPFWLVDNSGKILVFPKGYESWPCKPHNTQIPLKNEYLLAKKGLLRYRNCGLWYREHLIEPDTVLFVAGNAQKAGQALAVYKEKLVKRLSKIKSNTLNIKENKSEQLTQAEGETAGGLDTANEERFLEESLAAINSLRPNDLVIMKRSLKESLIISTSHRSDVSRIIRRKSTSDLLWGSLLIVIFSSNLVWWLRFLIVSK